MKKVEKQVTKKQLNKAYFKNILVFLFITLLPTQLGKHFFFDFSYLSGVRVDYLAPTIYLTDILAFILVILNYKYLIVSFRNKKILLTTVFLFITVLVAQDKLIALYRYIKILEVFSVYLIFKKQQISTKLLLVGFLIGGLFELLLTVLQFINKHSIQGIYYLFGERSLSLSMPGVAKASFDGIEFLRPYGTFSHPNSLAGFYLLIYFFILTGLENIFPRNNVSLKLTKVTLLFVCTILILISFSKLTIGVFVLLNIIYVWSNRKNLSCKFCLVSRLIILTIVSCIFLKAQTDPLTLEKRYLLFKNALEIVQNNALFGIGLGNYLIAQSRFYSKFFDLLNQPVHNIFLLFLSEVGVVTAFVIGATLFKPFKYLLRTAPFIFAAFILTGLFDHYWLTLQQNFLLGGVLFGVVLKDQH